MGTEFTGLKEFVIDSLIGEGGMGKVYRARQVALDRWVALKVLTQAKGMRDYLGRFYREARSAARLVHPNIIQIYTVGEHEGIPFFAMELIEGVDLHRMIQSHPVPLGIEESLEITRCVAKALAVAAEQGIVHRDIKPGNIMLAKGGIIKVMDFGLAKAQYAGSALTQPGVILGTPAYMSPEQGTGKPVDIRSDVYSLGCVLYTCLCDRPPFAADDLASLIYKHAYEAPAPPSRYRPGLLPELDDFCLKMLAKDPADRFQKPEDLLKALAALPFNLGEAEASLTERVNMLLQTKRKEAVPPRADRASPGTTRRLQKRSEPTAILSPPVAPGEAAVAPPLSARGAGVGRASGPSGGRDARPTSRGVGTPPANTTITQSFHRPPAPTPPSGVMAGHWAAVLPVPSVAKPPARLPAPSAAPAAGEPPALLPPSHTPPVAETRLRSLAAVFREKFQKLRDGRWSYRTELGGCSSAEGLVEVLRAPLGETPGGLGDCLLCVNWNKSLGCALAFSHSLAVQKQYGGLPLITRQANAWAGAGRFDMAIALLSDYVREHPDEPEGFRELARVYDRPDYDGPDKRRAIVLYQRFVELARNVGTFSKFELARAEEHTNALMNAPAEPKKPGIAAGTGVVFQCFYRGAAACFVYGVVTGERLILARVGDADPESGVYALEVCGTRALRTTVYKLLRKKAALAQARRELSRLARLTPEDLAQDAACLVALRPETMSQGSLAMQRQTKLRCLTIAAAGKVHELLFPETSAFSADQCHEALRRQIAKRKARK